MKKKFAAILAGMLLFSNAYAEDIRLEFNIGAQTAQLNGEVIEAPTYLSDRGNTMVGLRVAAQTLGISVSWEAQTRTVELAGEGLTMTVVIDSDIAIINGNEIQMTEPAIILNDRTMVPIRFVSEGFGAIVEYNDEMHSVVVRSSSHNERCQILTGSKTDMMSNYPSALQGWLAVTDDEVKLSDFSVVWDSIVNTKVMELLPGRLVTEELCNAYRTESGLTFDNIFKITGAIDKNSDITTPVMLEVSKDLNVGYRNLVFYPEARKIIENSQLPTVKPMQSPVFDGGGGSSSSGGGIVATSEPENTTAPSETLEPQMTAVPTTKPTTEPTSTNKPSATETPASTTEPTTKPDATKRPSSGGSAGGSVVRPCATPEPTDAPGDDEPDATFNPEGDGEMGAPPDYEATPEPTGLPTVCPTGAPVPEATGLPTACPTGAPAPEATGLPTACPSMEPTAEPTSEPVPTETPEPTPQITEGPSGDDDHFDDIIDGKDAADDNVILSTADSVKVKYRIWKPVFRVVRKRY